MGSSFFPWVTEVVTHQNLEKNPVLTKSWSHEKGLSTQQVRCCQLDHSKTPSPRVSLKKSVFPPMKWFPLFIASRHKIRSVKKDCFNEWRMVWLLHVPRTKYINGKKLSPSSLSQEFPNFQWVKTGEWITGKESRTIDAETMNMWNFHTDLCLLILKNSPYFEQEIGLFPVSQPVFIWSCLTCGMKTLILLPLFSPKCFSPNNFSVLKFG